MYKRMLVFTLFFAGIVPSIEAHPITLLKDAQGCQAAHLSYAKENCEYYITVIRVDDESWEIQASYRFTYDRWMQLVRIPKADEKLVALMKQKIEGNESGRLTKPARKVVESGN